MNKVTTEEIQKEFERVMELAQHHPITITENGKDLAILYPSQRVMEVAEELLEKNLCDSVKKGEIDILEALVAQDRNSNKITAYR